MAIKSIFFPAPRKSQTESKKEHIERSIKFYDVFEKADIIESFEVLVPIKF